MNTHNINSNNYSPENQNDCWSVINEIMSDLNLKDEVKISKNQYPFIVNYYNYYREISKDSLKNLQSSNSSLRDIKRCQIIESLFSIIKDYDEAKSCQNFNDFIIYKKPFVEDVEKLKTFAKTLLFTS